MKQPLIVLTGPTSVGKTEASLDLARRINGEIISADSMQIYKKMNIGTAKIMPNEMNGVPHHLVDEIAPESPFDVFEFKKRALACMEQIYADHKIPILVGGTGFYIQALLYDVDFSEEHTDENYRKTLEMTAKEKGHEYLHKQLQEVDEASAKIIHCNNIKRVIRALEYYHETGEPISAHNAVQRERTSPYCFLYTVLTMERAKLYERINQRVDIMIDKGLQHEVEQLVREGITKDMNSMQAIGYKEWFPYLAGEKTLEETVEQIKKDTRHFAKRQMTWFRREKEVTLLDKDEYPNERALVDKIIELAKEKGIVINGH